MTKIYGIIFLLIIIVLGLYLAPILKIEGFKSYDLTTPGTYPVSVDKPILNSFPLTGNKGVSNKNYQDIWRDYPEFSKSSFEQILMRVLALEQICVMHCIKIENISRIKYVLCRLLSREPVHVLAIIDLTRICSSFQSLRMRTFCINYPFPYPLYLHLV